jgi:hypothetical protein
VDIAGYLAAIPIPREYFLWFGHHNIAAYFITDMLTFVIPIFLIAIGWGILINLPFRTRFISTSLWSGLGCAVLTLNLTFNDSPAESAYIANLKEPIVLLQFFMRLLVGPCGILVGGYFLLRFHPKKQEALA